MSILDRLPDKPQSMVVMALAGSQYEVNGVTGSTLFTARKNSGSSSDLTGLELIKFRMNTKSMFERVAQNSDSMQNLTCLLDVQYKVVQAGGNKSQNVITDFSVINVAQSDLLIDSFKKLPEPEQKIFIQKLQPFLKPEPPK